MKSNFRQYDNGDFEFEICLTDVIRFSQDSKHFARNKQFFILAPILARVANDFERYSTEKSIKLKFRVNMRTLAITVFCATGLGVVSYFYGAVPGVSVGAMTALAYKLADFLPAGTLRTARAA